MRGIGDLFLSAPLARHERNCQRNEGERDKQFAEHCRTLLQVLGGRLITLVYWGKRYLCSTGCLTLFAHFAKAWVMGIIRERDENPDNNRPWNPALQKTEGWGTQGLR
jgi:hypothetical protein